MLKVDGDPWIVFSTGGMRPWLNGAIRKLAFPFFMLINAQYRWTEFNDVEAEAFKYLTGPVQTREQVEAGRLVSKLSLIRAGDTVFLPEGYDFKLLAHRVGEVYTRRFPTSLTSATRTSPLFCLETTWCKRFPVGLTQQHGCV